MKIKLLLFLVLIGICSAISATIGIEGKILDYGLIKVPVDQDAVAAPQTPSGTAHILHSPPIITTTTNRIPAKLGVAFGIVYEISDSTAKDGDEMNANVVMSFPTMVKPDGSKSKGFTWSNKSVFKDGKTWGIIEYSFDHDYELAPGLWRFEISVGGKILGSQDFTVYR
jgi:Domain of unknown function (DUF3859)